MDRRMKPPPPGDPGCWGTKNDPVIVSILGWNQMHPFIQERIRHAHIVNGYCIKNTYGVPCSEYREYAWAIDCDQHRCDRPAIFYSTDSKEWVCGVHR